MYDVIIIGGAFAGLSAATQLGRARRKVLVLDTSLPRNRFAAHSHGFFTRDGSPPLELLAEARRQLAAYGTVELRNARATGISGQADSFVVALEGAGPVSSRRIILAHGMTDDLSALPPGADACWGKSVFTCPYCHGYEFGDQRLGLLYRMGDPLEMVRFYKEWTATFTLFTNGNPIEPHASKALAEMNVPIVDDPVLRLEHDAGNLRAIVTASGSIPLDAMFAHPPARLSTTIGVDLGCQTKEGHVGPFYAVDATQMTTVPGIYAAGDAANPMPSISYAVSAGVAAGTFAHRSLLT
jgi:thioredoxin reductase